MSGARLVQWCGLFGVAEGTTRVALSRMVERGELRSHDAALRAGRPGQSRGSAQDWSLDPVLSPWDGRWRVAMVAPGPRSAPERAALRDAMRRLRFGALREGVWTRPDNLPRASAPPEVWKVADAQCRWWSGRPDDEPRALAATLFDGAGWARRRRSARRPVGRVSRARCRPRRIRPLADAFVAGAAALAHIRADPLLPARAVVRGRRPRG